MRHRLGDGRVVAHRRAAVLTLADIWQALAARGAVALTIGAHKSGFQVSARTEGSGWAVGQGPDLRAAVDDLIANFVYLRPGRAAKTRYFAMADGRLICTWNGEEPLAWEGSRCEVDAAEWARRKNDLEWGAMI